MEYIRELKPTLIDRFDKWTQAHPDRINNERTPDANLHHPTPDDAQAQAAAQYHEEEQRREKERLAAEEAARWRRQREEQEELTEGTRKDALVAARQVTIPPQRSPTIDYGYSRPHYRSTNTIVVSDRSRHRQQQEEMREREEEIMRRRTEAKRLQEQEAIAQKQHEAEKAARAARQRHAGPSLGGQAAFPQQTAPSSSVYQQKPSAPSFLYQQAPPPSTINYSQQQQQAPTSLKVNYPQQRQQLKQQSSTINYPQQQHTDGIDNERAPDANLPHPMPDDAQARAAAQYHGEERRRGHIYSYCSRDTSSS